MVEESPINPSTAQSLSRTTAFSWFKLRTRSGTTGRAHLDEIGSRLLVVHSFGEPHQELVQEFFAPQSIKGEALGDLRAQILLG